LEPGEAAVAANAELAPWFRTHPAFEVVLLGLGEDGHTASIFPGENPEAWGTSKVAAVFHQGRGRRLTLTPGALADTAELWFLAAGRAKAEAVARTLAADGPTPQWPATWLPLERSRWFLDRDAASALPQRGDA